jgi:hypothetical protein
MGVGRIGIYIAYAQAYNWILYPGQAASNNSSNLGGHVAATPGNQVWPRVRNVIIATALNLYPGISNDEYVARLYRGILGREQEFTYPNGGAYYWRIRLCTSGSINGFTCKGITRYEILNDFWDDPEPRAIYTAWGFSTTL